MIEKNSSKQIKIGAFLSYAQMILSIIIGLTYTPLMIRLLGQSEYGLYNTVSSTISMLSIINLGFGASYIRYYAKYKDNNDNESIYKLNGLFLIIFSIMGIIALICGLFLTFNLQFVFQDGLTSEEYSTAKILMLLLTFNLTISFPMSVFGNIINAHERFIFLKLFSMITTIIGPLVNIPILLLGYKSIGLVTASVSFNLVYNFITLYYVFAKLKQKFVFRNFEKGIVKSLFIYTSFIAINLIVDQINLNIDKLLLTRFKGTTAVAIYSVGFTIYNYYMTLSTSLSGVFTPRIHLIQNDKEISIDDKNKLFTNLMIKVGRIQYILLALVGTGFIFFGKAFIGFWAGDGYSESYYVGLLLVLPATIPLIQNLGIEIQRAKNKHQFRSIVYLIMALLNLGLSIWLCQILGATGSAIGTSISLIIANGFIMNIYYHKGLHLNMILFWKNILRMSFGLIIPAVCGTLLLVFAPVYNIGFMILYIIVYTIIYCISMWFLGINEYEKNLASNFIKKIFKKKIFIKNNNLKDEKAEEKDDTNKE